MQLTNDMELLRDYATRGSEPAFETLVHRHVNLVYSAAFRRVRDSVLAGEVTQTVFIILAKKAHTLSPATILSGWLYRTAHLAAGHALRSAGRRRKHEEEAAKMLHQEPETSDSIWEKNGRQSYRPGHWFMPGQTVQALADKIDRYFDLPVVDQTGLTGKYDIDLTWEPPPHGKPPSLEPFNQALIDQLGLELTPKIHPVKMLVIEKAR